MANPDFDTIATATLQRFDRTLSDNIFRSTPTLDLMRRLKGIHTGGRSNVKPLLIGENNTFDWYDGYDVLPCKPQEGLTSAEFKDAMASESISICGREELENRGTPQLISLLRAKTLQAQRTMQKKMNYNLINSGAYQPGRGMTGGNGKAIIGIEGLVNWRRYPELGGIDASRPNCAFWRSRIDDAGFWDAQLAGEEPPAPVPLKQSDLEDMMDCLTDGGDAPDFILMSKTLYQAYRSMLQPQYFTTQRNTGDIPFDNLELFGATVFWDHDVAEDTIYFLNSDYIEFECESGRDFATTDFRVPTNQDSKCAFLLFKGQVCTNNRSKHGMICNRRPC